MKIEVEIDEMTARALVSFPGMLSEGDLDPEFVSAAAVRCLSLYRSFPDTVTRAHLNALAIVRAKAVEAAQGAENATEWLFEFMLRDR